MSGRGPRKASQRGVGPWWESLWLRGLLQLALAIYLGLTLSVNAGAWWLALQGAETPALLPAENPGGPIGALLNLGLRVIFGAFWCWLLPLLLLLEGTSALLGRRGPSRGLLRGAGPLWLTSAAWLAQPAGLLSAAEGARLGGIVGVWLSRGFHFLFGLWGGRVFLSFLLLTALSLPVRPWLGRLGLSLAPVSRLFSAAARGIVRFAAAAWAWAASIALGFRDRLVALRHWRVRDSAAQMSPRAAAAAAFAQKRRLHGLSREAEPAAGNAAVSSAPGPLGRPPQRAQPAQALPEAKAQPAGRHASPSARTQPFSLPDLDLLHDPPPDHRRGDPARLDAAADLLEDTLRSFGVQGEVKDVRPGPVVTTFEYQPAAGTKVSQIVQRADDLALAMKARSIRMEAPIPGKAAVGIEIPNPHQQVVRLKEVLSLATDQLKSPLAVVLGKDVMGQPITIDIASLPHLLVAGSTGSGKSVCLNSLICNLLLRNDPSRVRLVLIDPKMLELNVYNGVPHLLLPVVTDPKEALRALKWMVAQMERRYRWLAKVGVRSIDAYNEKVARGGVTDQQGELITEPMPYYLTIVDELADLMLQLGQEFELPVTRLAQKARAVGIHLILATQRPSVDVLTGVIKANIPCRIAFRVIQKNDSRTILDMNGAEQLLGHGDMLYLQPGRALPVRVHGSFIEVDECEAIVRHWRQFEDMTQEIVLEEPGGGGGDHTGEDDLFEEARKIVVLHQSGSTSLLQRRLRVGYTRAGRLMDMLEEAGVVGPFTGSKARDVLIKPEDLPELSGNQADGAEA